MRKNIRWLLLLMSVLVSLAGAADRYIVLGWNDLGMHCCNKDFSTLAILPPYNNLRAQVLKISDAGQYPEIVSQGLTVTYEIPGNTYSVGKTNFWDYEDKLFGVNLAPDTGLTGYGLSGKMALRDNYFSVDGVPLTPYTESDLNNEAPFQLAVLKVFDSNMQLLDSTEAVAPVSNEINCVSSGCHSSEQDILNEHEREGGFDPNNKPILCASCHADNALGTTGSPGLESLSEVVHKKHGDKTNDCYKCHPGSNTQCLRGVMSTQHGMTCQDCHGSVRDVGQSIKNGREPWLEEPSCGDVACHGSDFAEEPGKLFRESKGHGGLYCSACHGEPHAIAASRIANDNKQNVALQGYAGTLDKCSVCHNTTPSGAGPHGFIPNALQAETNLQPVEYSLGQNYPNPFNPETNISFQLARDGKTSLNVYNASGQKVATLIHSQLGPGSYTVKFSAGFLPSGVYFYRLRVNEFSQTKKMFVIQ